MKRILFLLAVPFIWIACNSDGKEDLQPLDLLKYGVPVTIMAPDSADVKTMDLGIMQDVTIRKGEDYYVQVFASSATSNSVADMKADQISALKESEFFSQIIEEEENGFIYETKVDSTTLNYGFRHLRIQGDKEFVFQTGLIGIFTLDEVKRMYNAVKN